jgi:hypothetical protein
VSISYVEERVRVQQDSYLSSTIILIMLFCCCCCCRRRRCSSSSSDRHRCRDRHRRRFFFATSRSLSNMFGEPWTDLRYYNTTTWLSRVEREGTKFSWNKMDKWNRPCI